jgi:hypothetical protein
MAQYAVVDLDVYTDADYAQAFRQKIGDTDYYDFTGCTLHMMVRKHAEDAEVFLYLDSETPTPGGSAISIYDPGDVGVAGLFEWSILIKHQDLQQIPEGDYVQSLIVQRPDGLFSDIWRGMFINTIGPTRNKPIE